MNLAFTIYRNLEEFFACRRIFFVGHIAKKPIDRFMNITELTSALEQDEYVMLHCEDCDGKRPEPRPTYVILMKVDNQYESDTKKIKKLINSIPGFGDTIDILFITRHKFDSHRMKAIYKKSANTNVTLLLYRNLISNPLKHVSVGEHYIVNADNDLEWLYCDKDTLPKIKKNDPLVLWLDPEVGQIIMCANLIIKYRVVVPE
jgi:DNA-directed RNA polymerase subunit H (RpoH/RPB5)